MPTDIENQTIELLAATVEDEKKNVTYRWLSRSMGYSVNTAKLLMESYLSTVGKGKVHGTYYIARQDPETGNQVISLVSQEDLREAKKDSTVTGYHIYSLEPSPLKDVTILSAANHDASQLQKGKDINIFRVVHNRDVVVSKSNSRPTGLSSSGHSSASSSAVKVTTQAKQPVTVPTPATASTISSPAGSVSTSTASNAKTKPTAKSSMMSFFGKAATAAPKATTTTAPMTTPTPAAAPAKSSTLNFKRKADSLASSINTNRSAQPAEEEEEKDSDEEIDSEEERDRRLAMSSRLDQDQGDVIGHNSHGASGVSALDRNSVKKRQRSARLLAVDDDDNVEDDHPRVAVDGDDEEEESVEAMSKEARIALNKEKEAQRLALENMMLMDDAQTAEVEDEDSPMVDVETLDNSKENSAPVSPSVHAAETTSTPRRRRGHRAVTKRRTSRNARGYMVTEDYVEMESFSEDEVESPKAPAPTPVRAAESTAKGKAEGGVVSGGAKKKAGSGNQTLLNFFKKQN
ncbi:DNA polymerase delta subunit 3 [Dissophora ornata]|nr:DNA polymerase delta subunit 3 [Dissophora ornata]